MVVSGVLGREQLPLGSQWSWMPCCGFASQLTQELSVHHPPGWDPSCISLTGHQGWHSILQSPRLVSGRTHRRAAGRKRGTNTDPARSPLWLCPPGIRGHPTLLLQYLLTFSAPAPWSGSTLFVGNPSLTARGVSFEHVQRRQRGW